MTTNADITIFNKVLDPETRSDVFRPTVIRGVSIHMVLGSSSSKKNQDRLQDARIRIPITADTGGKKYVPSFRYKSVGGEGNIWTIQVGDLVVPHIADNIEVTRESDLWRNFDDVIVVKEYADNTTRGSDFVKHWRIGGM